MAACTKGAKELDKVGDTCTCCSGPTEMVTTVPKSTKRRLKRIGNSKTMKRGLEVVGCTHCDSPEIFRIAEGNERKKSSSE